MNLTDDGHFYFPNEDGHFVNQKQRRVAEILKDYDPKLQLQWIPPGSRNEKDEPFRVVCFPDNGHPYLVCTAMEADERLIANVFKSDQAKNGQLTLTWLDNYNRAIEIYNAKINHERRQERREIAMAAIRNNKSSYMVRNDRGELIDLERPGRRESRTTHIWR